MKAPPEEKRRRSVLRHKSRCPRTKKETAVLGAPSPPDDVRAEDDVRDKAGAGMASMTIRLPAGPQDIRPPAVGAAPRAACPYAPRYQRAPARSRLYLNHPQPPRRGRTQGGRYETQQSREKKMIFYSGPISLCRVRWLAVCRPGNRMAGLSVTRSQSGQTAHHNIRAVRRICPGVSDSFRPVRGGKPHR